MLGRHRIVGEVEDARPDLRAVVHPAAGEEDPPVGHQEQVRVQRKALPAGDVHGGCHFCRTGS